MCLHYHALLCFHDVKEKRGSDGMKEQQRNRGGVLVEIRISSAADVSASLGNGMKASVARGFVDV